MKKDDFIKGIQAAKAAKKERKFKQSVEFILNLKGLNLKKPEQHVDTYMQLPHERGKKVKVAALVEPELTEQAKTACDKVITHDELPKYTDKKTLKRIATEYDYFIAQANLMPDVAKTFGRVLGPRQKMPNPKAGCIIPPTANIQATVDKLKKTARLTAKTQASIKRLVGKEDTEDEQLAENIQAVYNAVIHELPQEKHNIKNVIIKLTMSPPVKI